MKIIILITLTLLFSSGFLNSRPALKSEPEKEERAVINGLLGEAIEANRKGRIKQFITDENSAFIQIFSRDSAGINLDKNWKGEHAGKWLYTASKAAFQTRDAALISNVKQVASFLIEQQGPDGYLGTYAPEIRITALRKDKNMQTWDIWVHGYLIEGLLELNTYFPDPAYVEACEKIGDLFIEVFQKGGVDIADASYHTGLVGTGTVGPMVALYKTTGKQKYLDFANYCVERMEQRPGLNLISKGVKGTDVSLIGNGKMYEMLRVLTGVVKLYEVTQEERYLTACKNIWQNIHDLHLTPAGGPWGGVEKHPELFNREFVFSPYGNMETCGTMDWLRFNKMLLRVTGEAKFAEEIEKTAYNALLGAQFPDGLSWVYHSHLNGLRERCSADACCSSSGTLALEELPGSIYAAKENGIAINVFAESSANLPLTEGGLVSVQQLTEYPFSGKIKVLLKTESQNSFPLYVRIPAWAESYEIKINGKVQELKGRSDQAGEYVKLEQKWHKNPEIEIQFPLNFRAEYQTMAYNEKGEYLDKDTRFMALSRGPLLYTTVYPDHLEKPAKLTFDAEIIKELKPVSGESVSAGKKSNQEYLLEREGETFKFSPYFDAGDRENGISRMTWLQLN